MVQINEIIVPAVLILICQVAGAQARIAASRLRYIWPVNLSVPSFLIAQGNDDDPLLMSGVVNSQQDIGSKLFKSRSDLAHTGFFVRPEIIPKGIHIDPDRWPTANGDESAIVAPALATLAPAHLTTASTSAGPTLVEYSSTEHAMAGSGVDTTGWIILSGAIAAPSVLLSALAVRVLKEHKVIHAEILMSSYSVDDQNMSGSENDDDWPQNFQLVGEDAAEWDNHSSRYLTMHQV